MKIDLILKHPILSQLNLSAYSVNPEGAFIGILLNQPKESISLDDLFSAFWFFCEKQDIDNLGILLNLIDFQNDFLFLEVLKKYNQIEYDTLFVFIYNHLKIKINQKLNDPINESNDLILLLGGVVEILSKRQESPSQLASSLKQNILVILEIIMFHSFSHKAEQRQVAVNTLFSLMSNNFFTPYALVGADIPLLICKLYSKNVSGNLAWATSPYQYCESFYEKHYRRNDLDVNLLSSKKNQIFRFGKNIREFSASDFTLVWGAKDPNKRCIVDDSIATASGLPLHEQQALATDLFPTKQSNIYQLCDFFNNESAIDFKAQRCTDNYTYLVVNFGMIISDRPHERSGSHRRLYKTMPLTLPEHIIYGIKERKAHAEEAFYKYIMDNFENIFLQFKAKFQLNQSHKIYSVILDLHGTYDMCKRCSKNGEIFQNKARQALYYLSSKYGIKLTHARQLPVVIRYGSNNQYHHEDTPYCVYPEDKIGAKHVLGPLSHLGETYLEERDLRYISPNSLVFSNKYYSMWKKLGFSRRFQEISLEIEEWGAFVSSGESHAVFEKNPLKTLETSASAKEAAFQDACDIEYKYYLNDPRFSKNKEPLSREDFTKFRREMVEHIWNGQKSCP